MAIELPKDAEGRDIPLDTKVLYDADGNRYGVSRFTYSVLRDYDNWDVVFVTGYDRYASETFLKPPDSWEKLKAVEDYGNSPCIDNPVCRYTNMAYRPCVECPNCGGQVDFHAGHIDNGRVFVCEKGKPPMREAMYHCRHCDSTVIFPKKCEPKGVDHD